jgi:hypothetical protein
MENEPKILMPVGWKSGQLMSLPDALFGIAAKMLAHSSDLLKLSENRRLEDCDRENYIQRAHDLQGYATALNSIALQIDPDRWLPPNLGDMLELAKRNGVTLPDWMTR